MRNYWKFSTAGKLIFGENSLANIGGIVKRFNVTNIMIITDPGLKKAGLLERLTKELAVPGINVVIYDETEPEPPVRKAIECYNFAKTKEVQLIIGFGGGSSIDLSKVIALLLTYGGRPQDYYGEFKAPGPVTPLIAIPTTSGTGSEVSPTGILHDEELHLKIGIADNYLTPLIALVDPVLTLGLPPEFTAQSGLDVLSHAVEAYTAIDYRSLPGDGEVLYQGNSEITDIFALKAIALVGQNLRRAVDQGSNMEARTGMSLASVTAGMAFANGGVGASHALTYPVGSVCHAPHGLLTGLLLPHVMAYNLPVQPERMAKIAEALGENTAGCSVYEAGQKAVTAVANLIADLRVPSRLSELGVKEEMLPELGAKTLEVDRLLRNNPRRVTAKYLEEILRKAY